MPCKLGCGMCCMAIRLNVEPALYDSQAEVVKDNPAALEEMSEDWRHILTHFHRITREEAVRINPHLKGWRNKGCSFYTCDWFDAESRLCTHHDERPPVCRKYPFYGGALSPDKWYTPDCGYAEDIGKTQEEVAPFEPVVEKRDAATPRST